MSGHFQVRKLLVYQKFSSFRTPFWVLKSSKFRITQQGYPIQNLRRSEPIGFGLGPSRQEIQEPPCMGPWETDRSGHQIWPQNDLVNGYLMVINGDSGWWFGTWLLWRSISYMGCHPSHWRTHIFQRGRYTTNQIFFQNHVPIFARFLLWLFV